MAIEDDLSASQQMLDNQTAFNQLLQQANGYRSTSVGDLSKEVNFLKSIGAFEEASKVHAKNMLAQQEASNKLIEKYTKKFSEANGLTKEQVDWLKKAAVVEGERLRTVSQYSEVVDRINTGHERQVELLRAQGSQIKANAKEWAKEKFALNEKEGMGQPGETGRTIAKGYAQSAQTSPDEIIKLLGPWGMLLQMFIGAADKIKKMGAGLQAASGATGEFGGGLQKFIGLAAGAELQFSSLSDALIGQMGMTSEEIFKDAGELASAGVKVSDTINGGGGMTETFQDLEAVAAATGQSIGGIGKQFTSIINTFRLGKAQAMQALTGVQNAAQGMLKSFDATMPELMSSIIGVD